MTKKYKLLIIVSIIFSYIQCNQEDLEEYEVPLVEIESPTIRSIDSLYLIAEIKTNTIKRQFDIEKKGFLIVNNLLNDTLVVLGKDIDGSSKFEGTASKLGIDKSYDIFAFIVISNQNQENIVQRSVYSTPYVITTDNILLNSEIAELQDNKVNLIGSISGIRDMANISKFGHLWSFSSEPIAETNFTLETHPTYLIIENENVDRDSIFRDFAFVDNMQGGFFYARAFAVYNDEVIYGETTSRYFGGFWEILFNTEDSKDEPTTQSLEKFPGKLAEGVSFVIDNFAYVGTGSKKFSNNSEALINNFWQFNATTKEWGPIATLPGPARKNAVAFSFNGKGYVGLGVDPDNLKVQFNDFYEFTPNNSGGIWKYIGQFPYPVRSATAFVLDGRAFVGTGYSCPQIANCRYISEFYELTENLTVPKDSMGYFWNKAPFSLPPAQRRRNSISLTAGNSTFLMAGSKEKIQPFYDQIFSINLQDKDVISLETSLEETFREVAFGFTIKDQLYIGGGAEASNSSVDFPLYSDLRSYDPINRSWSKLEDFPLGPVSGAMSFSVDEVGYVYGGYVNRGDHSDLLVTFQP